MKDTSRDVIEALVDKQRKYFATNKTKDVSFRIKQLKKLKKAAKKYESKIEDSLWQDLHKSKEEVYLTEFSLIYNEINNHLQHLKQWTKPCYVNTPLHLKPSKSKIIYEPLGVSLIIAPWNYPFQLLFAPLIGAISAGCCAVLKPSPDVPKTALVMQEMVEETFDPEYIGIVQGHRDTNTILLEQKFDMFFFTGSSAVGKVVMKAAAEELIPVVLELGGKSPCIVDAEANLDIAAKRIAWGKTINAGQTCIAPDYLFAHESIKDKLLDKIAQEVRNMFGENIKESKYYPRIVTYEAVDNLKELMQEGTIHSGGEVDKEQKYIEPTIIDDVKPEFKIMQEEIFGPILPVMTFKDIKEVTDYVNNNKKPLAFYYFGKEKKGEEIFRNTTSGGGCINDTLMHITNHKLPFGGVNYSGIGKYHGCDSFLSFSNRRSVVNTPTWIDISMKYAPFKHFNIMKRFI